MSDKLIAIFGYNSMSCALISQLNDQQNKLLVLDSDPIKIEQALQNGIPAQLLDYRQDKDLINIGIGSQVETLFCFLEHDSENVFLTLSARALAKDIKIISIVNQPESADKLRAAGATKIIDPFEICSNKAYQLLTKPSITWVIDEAVFGRADLHMAEITIPEGSCLDKTYASELQLNAKFNLLLIGIVDKELGDELYFSLGEQDHKLDVSDILVVLGANRDIRKFKQEIGVLP